MPDLVKRPDMAPSLASQTPTPENQLDGVVGVSFPSEPADTWKEANTIDYGDACFLDSDGTIKKSQFGVAGRAKVHGFAANRQRPGKPITIYKSVVFGYTSESGPNAAVPGKSYFLSAVTPGALTDTANGVPVAYGDRFGVLHVEANWNNV